MGFKPRTDTTSFSLVATADIDEEAELQRLAEISAEREMLAELQPTLIDLAADKLSTLGKWCLNLPVRAGRWLLSLPGRALSWARGLWEDFWGW